MAVSIGDDGDLFDRRPELVPLEDLSEARILAIMAKCLQHRQEHPVGSQLWAIAVLDYSDCERELGRRLVAHVVGEIQKRANTD